MERQSLEEQQRLLTPTEGGSFGGRYGFSCKTDEFPLVQLVRNNTSGQYTNAGNVTEDDLLSSDKPNVRRRNLSFYRYFGTKRDSSRRLVDDPDAVLYGRECPCSPVPGIYCPEGANLCKVALASTHRSQLEITCAAETQDFFIRYLFPLAVFMVLFFACLCFFSPKGRYSLGYFKKILCCWSEEQYKQALNEELDRMARRNYARRRAAERVRQRNPNRVYIPGSAPALSEGAGQSPDETTGIEVARRKVVVLKTRTFQDDEDRPAETAEETDNCAICLNNFENGDRVGDVRCGHIFHVECLKSWIQRKNHCPLCHENELATPQQEDRSTVLGEESTQPGELELVPNTGSAE